MELMRDKKTGEIVNVYSVDNIGGKIFITCFYPSQEEKGNNGWKVVKASALVPADYKKKGKHYTASFVLTDEEHYADPDNTFNTDIE